LNLSAYFNARKEEYKDELLEVSKTGNFDRWIQFFAQAVITQSQSEISRIKKLQELIGEMESLIKSSDGRGLVLEIPKTLLGSPYFVIADLAKLLDKSYPAVKTAVEKLVALQIVQEITIKERKKIFVSPKVMRILQEDSL
jgi:Fic family protein